MKPLMQRADVSFCGILPREEIDAMLAAPSATDVPLYLVRELSKARDLLDEAEQLADGSERLIALMDSAFAIEDKALQWIAKNRAPQRV
jgi:hypothetical protein